MIIVNYACCYRCIMDFTNTIILYVLDVNYYFIFIILY